MKYQLNQLELQELFKSLYAVHTVFNEDTEKVLINHEEYFIELCNMDQPDFESNEDKENFKKEQLEGVNVILHKLKSMIEEEE